jgi:uncharacterized protein (DUF433 family)
MATERTIEKTVIRKTPGVCGGDACIGNRRIMVWLLVAYRQDGRSVHDIMASFDPPVTLADLEAAWEYYEKYRDEIDDAIWDNEFGDDGDELLVRPDIPIVRSGKESKMTTEQAKRTSWIQKTPGVVGGKPCIRNTRISVHGFVEWRNLGRSDDQIIEDIGGLTREDLDEAWRYYDANRAEIDEILRREEEA